MKVKLVLLAASCCTALSAEPISRDPWLWPFAADSIWNTPIGGDADYRDEGHFPPAAAVGCDTEFFYKVSPGAPLRKLYEGVGWPVVDGKHGKFLRDFQIDDDVVQKVHTSNNCAAFLLPDGKTIEQIEPFIRSRKGGDVLGIPKPFFGGVDIGGAGVEGTHFGSGLSAFGGSLRHGELTGATPIRHALKLDVWCKKFVHYDAADATPGYRWPATNADNYAGKAGDGAYGGKNPRYEQGALLALHPRHTAESLGLKTKPGRLLLAALRDYGAYIVDDSAADVAHLCAQREAEGEFAEAYGYPIAVRREDTGAARAWYDDVMALLTHLSVVDNNCADNVAGGGTRRAVPAPPLGKLDQSPPAVPANVRVTASDETSVALAWSPATDDVRVLGYFVESNGDRVAETFGRTSVSVTGLQPDAAYTFTVRARDTGLNLSAPSASVNAHTRAVAPGTVLEDFDDGMAQGWRLENAAVRGARLEIGNWKGSALALCEGPTNAFTFSARIESVGGASSNTTRICFRRSTDGKSGGCVEFSGGKTPVRLIEQRDGQVREAASAPAWEADGFELTCDAAGAVTLTTFRGAAARKLFDKVPLQLPSGGSFGFRTQFNAVNVDDVRLFPSPSK